MTGLGAEGLGGPSHLSLGKVGRTPNPRPLRDFPRRPAQPLSSLYAWSLPRQSALTQLETPDGLDVGEELQLAQEEIEADRARAG